MNKHQARDRAKWFGFDQEVVRIGTDRLAGKIGGRDLDSDERLSLAYEVIDEMIDELETE